MAQLIRLESVTKAYYRPGQPPLVVLEHVSFTVDENEFVCIIGPSGCGKSTLLRIMIGLVPPTEGKVYYRDRPINGVCEHMAFVFQNFALFPWLTVYENIELGLEGKPLSKEEKRRKVLEVIRHIGLEGFEEAYPRELSGGMRQRVGLARALVSDPEVLLMDEPFSSLDVLTALHLREELLDLWADRSRPPSSIVMVTHDIMEAVYMADRILVMTPRPGTILKEVRVALGRPRDPRSQELYRIADEVTSLLAGGPASSGVV